MEQVLQTLVVALLVAASVVFAAWKLMPARARLRALDRVHLETSHVAGRWLARLRRRVNEELSHGCSACSSSADRVKKHHAR